MSGSINTWGVKILSEVLAQSLTITYKVVNVHKH